MDDSESEERSSPNRRLFQRSLSEWPAFAAFAVSEVAALLLDTARILVSSLGIVVRTTEWRHRRAAR
jgi:hypothetical protein